jgi:ribosomal protein S18 acetylase RimI-like enzyme
MTADRMTNLPLDKLKIRRIKLEDAEQIAHIQAAITQSPTKTDFKKIIAEQLRKEDGVSFVAEIDRKIAGYMTSYIVYGGFGLEKSAWIATLGVAPKFMGQGIGKRLAEEILTVYQEKGIRNILTSVRWDSVDLLSFFKTLGFGRSSFINLKKELEF